MEFCNTNYIQPNHRNAVTYPNDINKTFDFPSNVTYQLEKPTQIQLLECRNQQFDNKWSQSNGPLVMNNMRSNIMNQEVVTNINVPIKSELLPQAHSPSLQMNICEYVLAKKYSKSHYEPNISWTNVDVGNYFIHGYRAQDSLTTCGDRFIPSINLLWAKLTEPDKEINTGNLLKTNANITNSEPPNIHKSRIPKHKTSSSNISNSANDTQSNDDVSSSKGLVASKVSYSTKLVNNNVQDAEGATIKGEEKNSHSPSDKSIFKPRTKKLNTACPHKDRKHYAKNMCSACYHRSGRTKAAWKCKHSERAHYARGLCQNCYLSLYHQRRGLDKKLQEAKTHNRELVANAI
jgi:hypothetical protein